MQRGGGAQSPPPLPATPSSVTPTKSQSRRASTGGLTGRGVVELSLSGFGPSVSSIKVVCRFRPPKAGETCAATIDGTVSTNTGGFVLDVDNGGVEFVMDTFDRKSFGFDRLFALDATQSDVFGSLSDIVDGIMDGFNGAIMAYGQTSAGKSYTMEGPSIWDMEAQGTIPRAVDRIFDGIAKAESSLEFQVLVSYYEIYCEKVRDLLNPSQDNLKLRETKTDGFVVQDVTETYCTNRDDVLRLMELGKTYRQTAPTLMNAESSRSHSILSILLQQKDLNTGRQKKGRLFLVDLAGSEKVSKTGASGMRLEEAKNINSSLTTLGMVITALSSSGSSHVPYRDSKLTRLLSDVLGGNSKTSLVICCAPELRHMSETVSTLRFGERAKKVQNRVKINEELSIDELKAMLIAARKEIAQLRAQLKALGHTPAPQTGSDLALTPIGSASEARAAIVAEEEPEAPSEVSSASVDVQQVPAGAPAAASELDSMLEAETLAAASAATRALAAADAATIAVSSALAASQEEAGRLVIQIQVAQSEILDLRDRCAALEERLEVEAVSAAEAAGAQREREQELSAETVALRSTINELEGKLLRVTLEAKNLSPSLGSASRDREGDVAGVADVRSPHEAREREKQIVAVNMEASLLEAESGGPEVGGANYVSDAPSEHEAPARSRLSSTDENTYLQQYTNNALSPDLKELLEEEIKSLEANLLSKDNETRSAQASAVNYADKYIRLRDDYETHVQRLMMKLTREQQARIQAEDSLEDALQRLWNDEEERKNSGGFFSLFTSSSSGRSSERRGLSARERSLARSLDIAQSRAFQLAAELEATKEAHSIVLDTKESVMRSLVKQNSQLSAERDGLKKRADELLALNENLTGLLRSTAARKAAVAARPVANNTISGGGGGGVGKS